LQFCRPALEKVLSAIRNGKRNAKGSECCCSHCFVTQKHHEGSNNRDGRTWDSFHRFVNKGRRASAIGEAKYKLVFGAAEDLDAKFQNRLKNKDSPLHNCVTLNVTPSRLGSAKTFFR